MLRCSVVILNWNGADMLRRFLPSVVACCAADEEVVVADNGSSDESLSVLKDFPSVRVIRLEKNYGFAEGYNRALAEIDSRYVVLLNSDVEVSEGWTRPVLDYMDAHEQVAAAQPKILKWTPSVHVDEQAGQPVAFEHAGAAGGQMDYLGYPFCRGRLLSYVEMDRGQYDTTVPIFWATGCALFVRTRVYKEVGGLDADFFAHMEEIDLCWRLQCRGWQLVCVPESKVYHVGGGALAYGNPRKTFLNFRNNMLLLYKNLPLGKLLWVMPLRCMLDYAAAGNDLLHGRWGNAWAVVRARWAYHRLRPAFRSKRRTNRQAAKVSYPSIISRKSVFLLLLNIK